MVSLMTSLLRNTTLQWIFLTFSNTEAIATTQSKSNMILKMINEGNENLR